MILYMDCIDIDSFDIYMTWFDGSICACRLYGYDYAYDIYDVDTDAGDAGCDALCDVSIWYMHTL